MDEAGNTIGASIDRRTPSLDRPMAQRDPAEEVMSRSSQSCSCDERAGFEHSVVIGKTVDNAFDEFLR